MTSVPPPGQAPLVLIVDDVEDNRELYVQFLRHHGYRVLTAADGLEGVALTESARPDVVVMDLSLPRLDGIAATRQIKSNPALRNIPVVCLTGSVGGLARTKAVNAGADEYLTKPCLPAELLAVVAAYIGPPRPERPGS